MRLKLSDGAVKNAARWGKKKALGSASALEKEGMTNLRLYTGLIFLMESELLWALVVAYLVIAYCVAWLLGGGGLRRAGGLSHDGNRNRRAARFRGRVVPHLRLGSERRRNAGAEWEPCAAIKGGN